MMESGEGETGGGATRLGGRSRRAFWKCEESGQLFGCMKWENIITFYAMLKDISGVLSRVLSVFATSGANILTINQSIPTNGCAAVTISAETMDLTVSLEELLQQLSATHGVVKAVVLAG
mgnify:CR=1 FL=1